MGKLICVISYKPSLTSANILRPIFNLYQYIQKADKMQGTQKLVPLEPGKVMVIRKVSQNITTLSVRTM